MRSLVFILALLSAPLHAQDAKAPASANLMTLGPIDGESDAKSSVVTLRYQSKPTFAKPVVEAHGSFLQIVLPNTLVTKPGVFQEANSPYIRKFAPFQLDEDTAALRMFVTKEAEGIAPAVTVDILENRILIIIDHAKAEKSLAQSFTGVPVAGGPSSEQILKQTAVRTDIPDPISLMSEVQKGDAIAAGPAPAPSVEAAENIKAQVEEIPQGVNPQAATGADAAAAAKASIETRNAAGEVVAQPPRWADSIESKMIAVTIFSALMLLALVGIKSWRKVKVKTLPPGESFSLKTIATHTLGPKQRITVVQVGGEQILLGVSPEGINFLTSLRPQTEQGPSRSLSVDPSPYQRTLSPITTTKRQSLNEGAEPLARPTTVRSEGRAVARETKASPQGVEPGSSIRYGVGDEGIKNFKSTKAAPQRSKAGDESLEDVTRLIRNKLKDLPKV